jgi:hypothetical protein
MDTLRVNIVYRPLRIAWAIHSADFDAYRRAVCYSHALWGGRYNPIVFVDRQEEAGKLIDLFRVDMIVTIGDSDLVKEFPKRYPYLIKPFMFEDIFMNDKRYNQHWSNVLDIYNALIHLRDKPVWKEIKEIGVSLFTWQPDDPLADVFLAQLGSYPEVEEVGIDYRKIYLEASDGKESVLSPTTPIPTETIDRLSISYLSRYGLQQHYSVSTRHDPPGFFVGSVTSLDDLVCHWNLRACDIPLWFIDPIYIDRYSEIIPVWDKKMRKMVANYRNEWDRHVAVWSKQEDSKEVCKIFSSDQYMHHHFCDATWNRLNVMPPTMFFGEASVLGVTGNENGKPKVSFALADKPFSGDIYFSRQQLVASVSLIGGLYGNDLHTFKVPYLPELNEFYARSMHFEYDKLRVEPDRIGLVIDAADHDTFIYALQIDSLLKQVFGMAGYETKLSAAGLLTRQLVARLGGLQGARVFKIPGVRRLLKTHTSGASFLKSKAIELIRDKDPNNPEAKFGDHKDLHIEKRPRGESLTPPAVFGHIVEKGLYRIGAEILCPGCSMKTWIPLDTLKHQMTCDMCGHDHDATRQLVDNDKWHYRRSGVFGAEKNALGAIPVALTLQQLNSSFHGIIDGNMYSPSLDLLPKDGGNPCEIDFVWIMPRAYPRKTVVIIGECKDKGPVSNGDIDTLKSIAETLPRKRFKTFVVLSQISPFSSDQIEYAKTLNDERRNRAILLTARELEPYFMYERTQQTTEEDIKSLSGTPEGMAKATALVYFKE